MKFIVAILLFHLLAGFGLIKPTVKNDKPLSKGSLSFKLNGKLYMADSSHARGYANKQTMQAYINGANNEDMVIGIEIKKMKGIGTYIVNNDEGKVDFTINHKIFSIVKPGDYLKVTITFIRQQNSFLLLNGTFEASLQDKLGNKIIVTEGKFETVSL